MPTSHSAPLTCFASLGRPRTRSRAIVSILTFAALLALAHKSDLVHVPTLDELHTGRVKSTTHLSVDLKSSEVDDGDDSAVVPPQDSIQPRLQYRDLLAVNSEASDTPNPDDTPNSPDPAQALRPLLSVLAEKRLYSLALFPCERNLPLLQLLRPRLRGGPKMRRGALTLHCLSANTTFIANAPNSLALPATTYHVIDPHSTDTELPSAALFVAWPTLDDLPAATTLAFLTRVRRSGARFAVLPAFREVVPDDPAYEAWQMHAARARSKYGRLHDFSKPPFMFGHPRARFAGVGDDLFREMFFYGADDLVNEFA